MRETKFRGKRVDNGEWVYANHYGTGRESFERFWMDVADGLIDPETVSQSTGLKDKQGKEIYEESDTVKYQGSVGILKWRGYRYHFYNEDGYCGDVLKSEDLQVIENKDLLKE